MPDCFHKFLELFEKGEVASALSQIIPSPESSYDSLSSDESLLPYLVNYVDAAVFGPPYEIYYTNLVLCEFITKNKQVAEAHTAFLMHLKVEQELLFSMLQKKTRYLSFFRFLLSAFDKECHEEIAKLSPYARGYLDKKMMLSRGWISFQKTKPLFANHCLNTNEALSPPWVPFRYFSSPPSITFNPTEIPLIFLEPLNGDFSEMLAPLENRPALFIFETCTTFLHMLQFPEVVNTLSDPHHLLYILELYPNAQVAIQDRTKFQNCTFQPLFFAKREHIEAALPVLTQALTECLKQSDEALKTDNETGNWLYKIGKRLLFSLREERLGVSRAPAFMEQAAQLNWHDPHKGLPSKERELGPLPKDLMAVKLAALAKNPRRLTKKKLVHIVPQIVDEGHAPTRLLENLLVHHDRDLFEPYLFSTERLQFRLYDYPHNYFNSISSKIRAPKRLELFKSLGVPIEILENAPTYEASAQALATYLHTIKADIAVFHGPDAINYMAAKLSDTPLCVLFEHGSPPSYPGFDLAIVSSLEALEIDKELYAQLNIDARALPFQLDIKAEWEPAPYPKEKWGLPRDCKVMTTISHHLKSRLSNDMCLAIAEILKRVPNAFYVPIGDVEGNKEHFVNFFREHQVHDRVVFLGGVKNPSQYVRSMDLYLNEFPFGSGLGILEAMASGCPVVTMYDQNGPPQGRYGGLYFGIDKAVTSCNRKDYVELACTLLTNPDMYREWSDHAKAHYEKHANVSLYVKEFETILKDYEIKRDRSGDDLQ